MTPTQAHRILVLVVLSTGLGACSSGAASRSDIEEMYFGQSPQPTIDATPQPSVLPPTPNPSAGVPAAPTQPDATLAMPAAPSPSTPDITPPSGGASQLGTGVMAPSGQTSDRWFKTDVTRSGGNYFFMANGWGPGFESQSLSYNGTAFTVDSMAGSEGPNYEPASYPTVFCGKYSDGRSKECGLPAAIDSMTALRTGWRWAPNGNVGEYNAAYDIWMGDGESFRGFLMVWLREPRGQQPAGMFTERDVTVSNVPGTFDIWTGTVNNFPIINWVRNEGDDSLELEFDVLDFIRDAQARGYEVPGTHVLSVAVGFEIWNGPISNLQSLDFYVDVQ